MALVRALPARARPAAPAAGAVPARGRWRRRGRDLAVLVGRRVLIAVPILAVVSAGVFALAAVSPFDPLASYLRDRYERVPPQQQAELRQALGLDQPWWSSWWSWVQDLAGGDLGRSRLYGQPVAQVIGERLPWTMLLSGTALVVAAVLGIAVGVCAGLRPGGLLDRASTGMAVVIQAMPPFVLSLGAIAVFSLGLHLLPTGGVAPAGQAPDGLGLLRYLLLPVLVLALSQVPWLVLTVRGGVVQALRSDAVRAATCRGLPRGVVVRGHVLPVSLAPVVTVLGARLPELIVGAVIVEEVFAWPGLARALVEAAKQLDFPLLAVLTLATTALVLAGSLFADATYLLLDPRVSADD